MPARNAPGYSFESDLWNTTTHSDPNTPALTPTPGYIRNTQRLDANGCPVFKKLTSGVHWKHSSYPAWVENGRQGEASPDCAYRTVPSTPASMLNDESSAKSREDYWAMDVEANTFSVAYIASVVDDVRNSLGFQFDASVNAFELLMSQLDSKASRLSRHESLAALHEDYICGQHANFRKWYFAASVDLLDRESEQHNMALFRESSTESDSITSGATSSAVSTGGGADPNEPKFSDDTVSLVESQEDWYYYMRSSSNKTRLTDLAIYLLCWTEANQVRYMPECLAFVVKCARDRYYYAASHAIEEQLPEGFFLDHVITPLYMCYREYNFDRGHDDWVHRDNDHKTVIGYDDMNQLFWYKQGLQKIITIAPDMDGNGFRGDEANVHVRVEPSVVQLIRLPRHEWYTALSMVSWSPLFAKTYRESRTWLHLITNFSRTLIMHLSVFWYYTAMNAKCLYTPDFDYTNPQSPGLLRAMAIISFGGCFGPLLTIFALMGELRFVPRDFAGAEPIALRIILTLLSMGILTGPAVTLVYLQPWASQSLGFNAPTFVGLALLGYSLACTIYYSLIPLRDLYSFALRPKSRRERDARRFLANRYFTASFQKLDRNGALLSISLWTMVFACKFVESYFFLTLSLKDPLRELFVLDLSEASSEDRWLGTIISRLFPKFVLSLVVCTDFVLFCLDTYLWYVIFNTVISVAIALRNGASIWTPWRNAFSRLPQRISAKMLTPQLEVQPQYSNGLSMRIIWNSIVESFLVGNLVSRSQAEALMFVNPSTGEPRFFSVEEDSRTLRRNEGDAYRRISFFAQSLSSPLPRATSVEEMPSFTVLIPHYKEKILLGLNETINAGSHSKIAILEYLQKLYPSDWRNFVEEIEVARNLRAREWNDPHRKNTNRQTNSRLILEKLGFDSVDPNDTSRTRMWCSKRAQTLYRTISGFSSYTDALKVLHVAETQCTRDDVIERVRDLCGRKFRLLVAMQLYQYFCAEQLEDVETIMRDVPELVVSYVERLESPGGEDIFYSCLFDSSCPLLDSGHRVPRIRIRLSGNPILGDGKSDNQNNSLIFYRGEYIQLVDANQDNYLEECLKIRNLLMEFEDDDGVPSNSHRDVEDLEKCEEVSKTSAAPVAIVGAREYIFSENIGILGDVAAGKEQTFGTLFARTLAVIGAKLHYGHPDFVNAVFMTTRGGVSKGQRGLHLNEDIYAGMTAMLRGGRIKHSEYVQCGKGRDLGFVSILNFTSKIGAGMGEQILSREYFYMGTQLPFDRFTSFYFAHPGFHVNNLFITLALQLLLLVLLWIATIASFNTLCEYDSSTLPTTLHSPPGCVNLVPLVNWIRHCVVSIFLVFFISLCPLFFHELIEKGCLVSMVRILKHFGSLSMFFEVFVAHVYARSFSEDLNIGGARYVATGRDFATTRIPFSRLYSGYSCEISKGCRAIMALVYASAVLWHPCYLWFWVTSLSLCVSPLLYNPHQFSFVEFAEDYRHTLQWFYTSGGASESWSQYIRSCGQKITGVSKRSRTNADVARPNLRNMLFIQLGGALVGAVCFSLPYLYASVEVASQADAGAEAATRSSVLFRLAACAALPIASSLVVHCTLFLMSLILNLIQIKNFANVVAMTARCMTLLLLASSWWLLYVLEHRSLRAAALGALAIYGVHQAVCTLLTVLQCRQYSDGWSNTPWWTGSWSLASWRALILVPNEMLAKVVESVDFGYDFVVCHALQMVQLPLVAIPYIDKLHSLFLLWLRPSVTAEASRQQALSPRRVRERLFAALYVLVLVLICALLGAVICFPFYVPASVVDALVKVFDAAAAGAGRAEDSE